MKPLVLALMLLPTAAWTQSAQPPVADSDVDKGLNMMQQGAGLLLNHMLGQVGPDLAEMAQTLQQAQPRLLEILALMGDLTQYHAPEKLPNGDILLRRKSPAQLQMQAAPGTETDL